MKNYWGCKICKIFALLIVFSAIWTTLVEPRWVAKRNIEVSFPHSEKLTGLRIAVAADWHLTTRPFWRVMTSSRAKNIVKEINDSHPDIILLPGDFIADSDYKPINAATAEDEIAQVLGQLKAPLGVYAVLGNHDWRHGGSKFKNALTKHSIQVIENDSILLEKAGFWLVGVGDDSTGHANPYLAIQKLPKAAPAFVMLHDPASFSDFPTNLNAISFAGHTHGGQVYFPRIGALIVPGRAPNAWAYGWIKHNGNRMYVTSGLGVSILPIRLNMRPEWVMVTVK